MNLLWCCLLSFSFYKSQLNKVPFQGFSWQEHWHRIACVLNEIFGTNTTFLPIYSAFFACFYTHGAWTFRDFQGQKTHLRAFTSIRKHVISVAFLENMTSRGKQLTPYRTVNMSNQQNSRVAIKMPMRSMPVYGFYFQLLVTFLVHTGYMLPLVLDGLRNAFDFTKNLKLVICIGLNTHWQNVSGLQQTAKYQKSINQGFLQILKEVKLTAPICNSSFITLPSTTHLCLKSLPATIVGHNTNTYRPI